MNYASPVELLFSPDGARLYVLCQQSNEVRVLDAASNAVVKNIPVGKVPRGFSLSPQGDRLFVANSWDDTLSVIDTQSLEVTATWPVAAEPSSVIEGNDGKHLFVANRISNDMAVLDAQTGAEEKRLAGGTRSELHYAHHQMAGRLYVTHVYPNLTDASHGARVGDHGDRYSACGGCGTHSTARYRARLSCCVFCRWTPWRCREYTRKTWFRWRILNTAAHLQTL